MVSSEERPWVRRCSPFRAAVPRPTFQLHLGGRVGGSSRHLAGEGGEQGDPLMPALFALGQHEALEAICMVLLPSEKLFAFLDDIFIVGAPECMAFLHAQVESALWDHARIRINQGKTQLWNRAGVFPVGCEHIPWMQGGGAVPPVIVWRGDQSLPTREQGIRVLGTPLGHGDHVEAEVLTTNEDTPPFSAGSWQCAICSVRGSSCSFAHLPGRTTCCGLSTRRGPMLLREHTTPPCGTVFASCWTSPARRR